MALSTYSGAASFDVGAGTLNLDLSQELEEVIRQDNTALLNRVGSSGITATQVKHEWINDSLNANTATESGVGINSSIDTFSVVSGQGTRFKVGTLFKDNTAGKTEVMQVTAVTGDALTTIVRGYGSTTGEAHAASFPIMIIAHAKQEGWEPGGEDWTKERTESSNYTQIFGRGINVSYTRQAIDHAAIPNEFAHQTAYRTKEAMRELDSSLINGIRSGDAGSDTSYRSAGGLIEFVSAVGGNVTTTSEELVPSVINAMAKQIWDDAGFAPGANLFLLVGGVQKRKIAAFDQAYRRMDFNSDAVGYTVNKFLTDLGFELEIVIDPWMPDDTIIMGDWSRIKVGPLTGDALRVEDLAKTGRSIQAMVTGQYTNEIRSPLQAFAIHSGLIS